MKSLITLPLEETVDVATAARMAMVSQTTVRRWCDEGRIACLKPFGRWRIYRIPFLASISAAVRTPVQLNFRFPEN
jgi:predicted site-specific integrase-resolvase